MKVHVLRNGIRVVMEPMHSFRSVALGIWVRTGSRNETAEENGISHMIEHMLFKGTKIHTAQQIADRFDEIGGHVNAFTSKEYTCYYAKVLDDHIDVAVSLLADMFFESVFAPEELEKERNVILEEIAMYEDTPDDAVHDLNSQASYGSHPLGFSIIGSRENVRRFQAEDLKAYMKKWYHADELVIGVAGHVDDRMIDLLEQHFGLIQLEGSKNEITAPSFEPKRIFLGKKTEQSHLCMSLPGVQHDSPFAFHMAMVTNIIGGGMSSRLFQEVREKRGMAYSVFSYHSSYIDSGLFTVYAGTAPNQTETVVKVILDVMRDVIKNGITPRELERCKSQMKGSFILGLEGTNNRMNRIAKNTLLGLKQLSADEVLAKIDAVELEQVNALINERFSAPLAMALVGKKEKVLTLAEGDKWYE